MSTLDIRYPFTVFPLIYPLTKVIIIEMDKLFYFKGGYESALSENSTKKKRSVDDYLEGIKPSNFSNYSNVKL